VLPLTSRTTNLCHLFFGAVLFWVLQAGLVLFALYAFLKNSALAKKAGRGGLTPQPIRGDFSMEYFFVAYAAINGLRVAICFASVDVAVVKNHLVLWIVVDTAVAAYVCLFNGWFRNHLLGFVRYLSKLERR
jgi:hypothetical protein